ncbi:anti-sigma factor family protein [Solirhodobacter olei]|uniref:anti-sigma factor family protein n=1 Tax=Solirhodobacter olei TaxID=2493082 RepID=UPI000FDB92E1|nr:anti-sigma factor [Solirhodobacter olei]
MTQADLRPDPVPLESLLLWHSGALPERERRLLADRIDGDPEARATLATWRRQDSTLASLYAPVADQVLPEEISALLDDARTAPIRPPFTLPRIGPMTLAILFLVLGTSLGWVIHDRFFTATGPNPALDAARAYRTYVVETLHPVEVPASDATHLTAWVSARLGHEIHAPDFTRAGFLLMGGRVLPSAGGPAALFMYQDSVGQRLALYIAPGARDAGAGLRFYAVDGTQGFWWIDRDLSYALAGPLPRSALQRIATMAYDQML